MFNSHFDILQSPYGGEHLPQVVSTGWPPVLLASLCDASSAPSSARRP